jgi:photosystem II stability/assembly factor-like uncharacterized protein
MMLFTLKNLLKFNLKTYLTIFAYGILFPAISQITQINTGTKENLLNLSYVGNKLLISGSQTYLASSTDECQNLNQISKPNSTFFFNTIQRLDTNNIFLFSYTSSQALIYHSINCGNTWIEKYNSTGAFRCEFGFNDTLLGFMTKGNSLFRTIDGGINFTQINTTFQIQLAMIRNYGDSTLCLSGLNVSTSGIMMSKDKGKTWSQEYGIGNYPSDAFFISSDTAIACSNGGTFIKTYNCGLNWDYNSLNIPLKVSNQINFRGKNIGFVVGSDNLGYGTIAKTNNLGMTWSTFNTGIKSTLFNIAFLNDSIAFLSGSNGVLLRWNYKQSIFTGEDELSIENIGVKIYPNPVSDKLKIDFVKNEIVIESIRILNTLGATLFESKELKKELDVSFLKPGLYFLKIVSGAKQKTTKFIKE